MEPCWVFPTQNSLWSFSIDIDRVFLLHLVNPCHTSQVSSYILSDIPVSQMMDERSSFPAKGATEVQFIYANDCVIVTCKEALRRQVHTPSWVCEVEPPMGFQFQSHQGKLQGKRALTFQKKACVHDCIFPLQNFSCIYFNTVLKLTRFFSPLRFKAAFPSISMRIEITLEHQTNLTNFVSCFFIM